MEEKKFDEFCDKVLLKTEDMSDEQMAILAGKIMNCASMNRNVVQTFLHQWNDIDNQEEFGLQVKQLFKEEHHRDE